MPLHLLIAKPFNSTQSGTCSNYPAAIKNSIVRSCTMIALVCSLAQSVNGQAEAETNNTFETANPIAMAQVRTGSVGQADQSDYFMAVLPTDGTLKIYVNGTNNHPQNSYLYMYGYDVRKANGQVYALYVDNNSNVAPGGTVSDTITIHGRAADTFYFRLETPGLFSFSLGYTMEDLSPNDGEPNNTFADALAVDPLQVKEGHIGYVKAGLPDANDFYKTALPYNGTLIIYVQGKNNWGSNGYIYMYGYDKRQANGQIFAKYLSNNSNVAPGVTIYDTIKIYGRAADSFYFRMTSAGSFNYQVKYDVTDTTLNDAEPNDTYETALPIAIAEEKNGNIGYVKSGVGDASDYYMTVLPYDGTMKIYVQGTNHNGTNGYMYLYGYDKRKANGQVLAKYIGNNSNVAHRNTITDTIYLYGRAADTFYLRMTSAGAFSYSIKYDVADTSENDIEPNDNFEEPILLNQLDVKKGHIGYLKNGTRDNDDFYKTVIPIDGTLKIFIQGTNRSGANNYLYLYGYDRRKGGGQIFSTYVSGSSNIKPDSTIYDTITIYGVLADTFYFRVQSAGAFSYHLSYNTTINSAFDQEPNNTFEDAITTRQGILQTGQIGYTLGGNRDSYDYYVTNLPNDGTLKIMVQGTNNGGGNGYMFMYGFDRRKGSGQVLAKYVGNNSNVAPGVTVYDTIYLYGRAADTFYFRIESAQPFSYNFSYDIIDTSENDLEPNSNFNQAIPIASLERKKGHIGYVRSGAGDGDDYYRTVLPVDGRLKIIINGTNNSGAPGYLYIYGYDSRRENGQILSKYAGNNSNVPYRGSVSDTIYLYGRAADTTFFRISSAGAFSYSLQYEIDDTSENDAEPNGTFEEASTINHLEIKKGHIGYTKHGVADASDYYSTVLPSDGTLRIIVSGRNRSGANGYIFFYGYDRRKANGQVLAKYLANNSNIKADSTIYDTIYLHGRAADTFYYRITSAGAWNYQFHYEMRDTSENDLEPNNTFETALPITRLDEKKGHIAYAMNGTTDQYDYYRAVLPEDGTLKIMVKGTNNGAANSYMFMYGFDRRKANGQVFARYISNNSNVPPKTTLTDTFLVHCRAADTFYFRIEALGPYNYTLSYDMVNGSPADSESNNTFETANAAAIDSSYNGNISYIKNGVADANDYFVTAIPAKGTVRIITEARNSSGSNGYIYLYGYDKRKGSGQIMAKYLANNSNVLPGTILYDTININCTSIDTFYLRLTSSGCFSYKFKIEHIDHRPKADMTYERLGNQFGFRPQLANANSFIWSFGDNTTSTSQYPLKTYTPGFYTARLIATNTVCNFKDTALRSFEIKGVEYYTPDSAGAGGDLVMKIFGGGLDTTTKVKLVQGNVVIQPREKYTNTIKNQLSVIFDLHFASNGLYDVKIEIPGEPEITYPGGFRINNFRYPYTKAEVQGPSVWRINSDTRFTLVVNNTGNVIANHVVVGFVWPQNVTVNWETKFITPPDTGIVTVTLNDTAYSLPRSDYHFIYDSLNTKTPIDTFNGSPYNGFIRFLLIPHVPAGATIEFPFIARTTVPGGINFKAFTYKPNQLGSPCPPGNWQDHTDDLTAELIDGADMIVDKTNVPLLKAFTKTAKIGQKHAGSAASFMGKHFWAWYDGYEVDGDAAMADWLQETEANNAFALQTATDELGNLMLDKGIGKLNKTYQDQVDFINKRLGAGKTMSPELAAKYIDKLNKISNANQRLNGLKELYKNTKDLASLSDKLLKIQQLANDCPDQIKQLEDLLNEVDNELNKRDIKEKPTNPVASMDPNEITGPEGFGANRYLNNVDKHHFQVSFENIETATAAAQMVMIRDTLDKYKFDLKTFEFGGVSIGKKHFRVPKGRNQFVIERSLIPVQAMRVRINAKLDTATGIIEWQFTAIDPITNDIPVFEGFLPPNITKPNGEGSVTYTVNPKSTLADGTVFTNRASIVFDQNDPILTNTWQNILDIVPPASTLSAIRVGDTTIKVSFTANDGVSGIGFHNLYVSTNNGIWQKFSGTTDDTLRLEGDYDSSYRFFVIAQDKVGNLETKSPIAEATIIIPPPLAILIGNITATNIGTKHRIDWNTLTEDIGDKFEIQKSTNGRDFSSLATIAARGNAGNYTIYDDQPIEGRTFYRLKTIDNDGTFKISKVVSAYLLTQGRFVLEAYPNPVNDKLTINLHGTIEGKASLVLVNMMGTVVHRADVLRNQVELNLGSHPAGTYFIRYSDSKNNKAIKITKL